MVHLRTVVLSVFVVCMFSMLGGCKTATNLTKGTAESLKQDTVDTWNAAERIDKWMRENLW